MGQGLWKLARPSDAPRTSDRLGTDQRRLPTFRGRELARFAIDYGNSQRKPTSHRPSRPTTENPGRPLPPTRSGGPEPAGIVSSSTRNHRNLVLDANPVLATALYDPLLSDRNRIASLGPRRYPHPAGFSRSHRLRGLARPNPLFLRRPPMVVRLSTEELRTPMPDSLSPASEPGIRLPGLSPTDLPMPATASRSLVGGFGTAAKTSGARNSETAGKGLATPAPASA